MYEGAVQDLIDELGRLPGIGPKSAQRIAFHLLAAEPADVIRLMAALQRVKDEVRFCRTCGDGADADECRICRDARRDGSARQRAAPPGRPVTGRAAASTGGGLGPRERAVFVDHPPPPRSRRLRAEVTRSPSSADRSVSRLSAIRWLRRVIRYIGPFGSMQTMTL